MFDFTELPADGVLFEQLVREIAFGLGYRVEWTGQGADDGRDLLIEEVGDALLGGAVRRWLVSCKHFAHANNGKGRAVGVNDVHNIRDLCTQHNADGFVLACSTHASSGVVTRLSAFDMPTHVWGSVDLERMLQTPPLWAVGQRFLPRSTESNGWRVWATDSPNHWVGVSRGFYMHLHNRHGSTFPYQLASIDERLNAMADIGLEQGEELRPRAMWCDDKNGNFRWYADWLFEASKDKPNPTRVKQVLRALGNESVSYDDGQFDSWDIVLRSVHRLSDTFDADHYTFYNSDVGVFAYGGERRDAVRTGI